MKTTKPLKVFYVGRCWKNPRGQYLLAAHSAKQAAELLGCSAYFLKTYALNLSPTSPDKDYETAMTQPLTVFKRAKYSDEWKVI